MPKIRGVVSIIRKLGQRRFLFWVLIVVSCFTLSNFSAPVNAQLEQGQQNAQLTAEAAGVGETTDLVTIVGRIINIFLGFLGVIFLVLMLYAGYLWMTAGGEQDKVTKAQSTIKNAIIGLVIIASAWAITSFILGFFTGNQGGTGGVSGTGGPGGFLPGSSGSLGAGVIEYHLPERGATGVPRNTPVIITFKEPMLPDSFIEPGTGLTSSTQGVRSANVQIFRSEDGATSALQPNQVMVSYTADSRTFKFKPIEILGSSTNNVNYTVKFIGGNNGIKKADGSAAFTGSFGGGYEWSFEVSTFVDLTPPYVTAVVPLESGGSYFRNVVIQINFNEAVDPTAATGKTATFSNITALYGAAGEKIVGEYKISNKYRTIEFIPEASCGVVNSCGREIFCLPGNQTIDVTVKAADVDAGSKPQAIFYDAGYNGVVDVVGNSFDGDKSGTSEGQPNDNYSWSFATNNDMKLTPPKIIETIPPSDSVSLMNGSNSNVPVDQPVKVSFDTFLQSSTLNTDNAYIDAHGMNETDPDTFWWLLGMNLLTSSGTDYDPEALPKQIPTRAALLIYHRLYMPSGEEASQLNWYDPYILSGIQDMYQNCFNPAASDNCAVSQSAPNCCDSKSTAADCKTILNP